MNAISYMGPGYTKNERRPSRAASGLSRCMRAEHFNLRERTGDPAIFQC